MIKMEETNRYRQEFPESEVKLPGVALFGHNLSTKAGAPLQTHSHPNCVEVVLVVRGEQVYSAGKRTYTAAPGTAFVAFSGEPHENGGRYSSPSEFYWFQLNVEAENFLGLAEPYSGLLRQAVAGCREHLVPVGNEVLDAAKRCHRALMEGADPVQLVGLFCSMAAGIFLERRQAEDGDSLIHRVREYIEENIEEELSLAQLSNRFSLSESGLQHRFRKETGDSLRSYINQRKIEKAKKLLEQGKSVTETAMTLGFSSSDYFSTVFRRYTNIPPTRWISLRQVIPPNSSTGSTPQES